MWGTAELQVRAAPQGLFNAERREEESCLIMLCSRGSSQPILVIPLRDGEITFLLCWLELHCNGLEGADTKQSH